MKLLPNTFYFKGLIFSPLPLLFLLSADNCQFRWECYSYVCATAMTTTKNLFILLLEIQWGKTKEKVEYLLQDIAG